MVIVSVTELPGVTLSEVVLGSTVIVGGAWLTEKIRVALLFVKPRELLVYTAAMVWDPTTSAFDTATGNAATPELLTVTAGSTAPSTVKTTDPTGANVPDVAKTVALI
jgi:hypothetical protein